MGSAIEIIIVKHKEPTMTFLNKYKSGLSSNLSCIVLPLYSKATSDILESLTIVVSSDYAEGYANFCVGVYEISG